MKTVKVKKAELLKLLKKNRAAHKEAFEDAFLGYSRECQRILKENLEALRQNKRHRVMFHEQPPEDHTIEYDRVIRMAEMSVDAVLESVSYTHLRAHETP